MASTFTSNLNLEKPSADMDYDVAVPNANMDKIDALLARAVICTSTTRPTGGSVYPGLIIFETDTGLLLVRNGANTIWLQFTEVFSCTSGTRPTATHPGMLIYETDTNCLLMRNGTDTAWVFNMSGIIGFNTNNNSSATTSTTFVDPGNMPGLAYVVPPSGSIKIDYSAKVYSSLATANQSGYVCPQVRQGNVVGGGTILLAASDANSLIGGGNGGVSTPAQRFGASMICPGLTPGNFINVQLVQKSSHATASGTSGDKKLIVSAA